MKTQFIEQIKTREIIDPNQMVKEMGLDNLVNYINTLIEADDEVQQLKENQTYRRNLFEVINYLYFLNYAKNLSRSRDGKHKILDTNFSGKLLDRVHELYEYENQTLLGEYS